MKCKWLQSNLKTVTDFQLRSLVKEAIIPDSFFGFPADQISFLYGSSKHHFPEIRAMIKLRTDPDFLATISRYTIRNDMAILWLLGCTGETNLDGVRSVVDNKSACWQCLLSRLTVTWHLLSFKCARKLGRKSFSHRTKDNRKIVSNVKSTRAAALAVSC